MFFVAKNEIIPKAPLRATLTSEICSVTRSLLALLAILAPPARETELLNRLIAANFLAETEKRPSV